MKRFKRKIKLNYNKFTLWLVLTLLLLINFNSFSQNFTPQWYRSGGGNQDDAGLSNVRDNSGFVYVTGYIFNNGSATFCCNTSNQIINAPNPSIPPSHDIFVAKYHDNPANLSTYGDLIWLKVLGSTNDDEAGLSIALDGSNNPIVAGKFSGTSGNFNVHRGATDCFVMKMDQGGSIQWLKTFGGPDEDEARSVSVDLTNNIVYVSGFFSADNSDILDENGNIFFAQTTGRGKEIFVVALSSTGSLLHGISAGSAGWLDDFSTCVKYNSSDSKVYLTGGYSGTNANPAVFGSLSPITSTGLSDIFIAQCTTSVSGNLGWVNLWHGGGTSDDGGNSIAVHGQGIVYVTGTYIMSCNFGNQIQLSCLQVGAFLGMCYFPNNFPTGVSMWAKNLGPGTYDVGTSVQYDPVSGSVFVSGYKTY